MLHNPVMFVVEVGAVLTTLSAIGTRGVFAWVITVWLWLTSVFANLAEAVAEGRGKAQAESLRRAKTTTMARRLADWRPGAAGLIEEEVPGAELRLGDHVIVEAGQTIPGDGDVVEGVASVDESAITGESAPVIRESGGDRSAVTGGTKVLSDRIIVKITSKPGETFIDRMIALVEGAARQKTPNEIALNILLASLTIIFLVAVVTLQPFAIFAGAEQTIVILVALVVALIPTTIGALLSAIGIAGMDRLVQRNVLAMSGRAVEAAGMAARSQGKCRMDLLRCRTTPSPHVPGHCRDQPPTGSVPPGGETSRTQSPHGPCKTLARSRHPPGPLLRLRPRLRGSHQYVRHGTAHERCPTGLAYRERPHDRVDAWPRDLRGPFVAR